MPKLDHTAVFVLVKSLTKAEKRYFKLRYVTGKKGEDPLFVQLFESLSGKENYDEEGLLKEGFKKSQLSNLKRELYIHILEVLQPLEVKKDIRVAIRRQIDFAQVLYNKGLYHQSLKILDRVKQKALKNHEVELTMQIIEFEKIIEARHITRSIENRADQLQMESAQAVSRLNRLSHLSSLALTMYGEYIKRGHVRSEEEAQEMKLFFSAQAGEYNLSDTRGRQSETLILSELSFYERVNLYQAHAWYAYILQDFPSYYRYAQKWVNLFDYFPEAKEVDTALYLKAMNNLLTAHFYTGNGKGFYRALTQLDTFWEKQEKNANQNTKTLAFVYRYTAKFNGHFMEGTFDRGRELVEECLEGLRVYDQQIDEYRRLVFYYKIASIYFGSDDNVATIRYLNKIVNLKIGNLKADIQCFARILLLIAHYESNHFDVLFYLLPSVTHFLERNKEMSKIFIAILEFLKSFNHFGLRRLPEGFIVLKERLIEVAEDPYERRFFLYLDVISWLESKIEGRPVQQIIQEKYTAGSPRI